MRALLLLLALGSAPAAGIAQEAIEEDEGYRFREEAEVAAALEETLAQPEFARLRAKPEEEEPADASAWMERLYRWLVELFGDENEEGTADVDASFLFGLRAVSLLVLLLVAAVVGGILGLVVRAVVASARDRKIAEEEGARGRRFEGGAAPGEVAPDEYFERALELGRERKYKEGIRELLLGAMSATERRGLIRFRRGLTNRDYLYSVRGPARLSFERIATAFEHVYFGRRSATSDSFRECCREYEKSFRGAAA